MSCFIANHHWPPRLRQWPGDPLKTVAARMLLTLNACRWLARPAAKETWRTLASWVRNSTKKLTDPVSSSSFARSICSRKSTAAAQEPSLKPCGPLQVSAESRRTTAWTAIRKGHLPLNKRPCPSRQDLARVMSTRRSEDKQRSNHYDRQLSCPEEAISDHTPRIVTTSSLPACKAWIFQKEPAATKMKS